MARSKSFGTKRIPAVSARAREITRFIDERRDRSSVTGRYVKSDSARRTGDPRKEDGSSLIDAPAFPPHSR